MTDPTPMPVPGGPSDPMSPHPQPGRLPGLGTFLLIALVTLWTVIR